MTDDIAPQLPDALRMWAGLIDEFSELKAKDAVNANWLRQAADEIERLRKELDNIKAENQRLSQIARY